MAPTMGGYTKVCTKMYSESVYVCVDITCTSQAVCAYRVLRLVLRAYIYVYITSMNSMFVLI